MDAACEVFDGMPPLDVIRDEYLLNGHGLEGASLQQLVECGEYLVGHELDPTRCVGHR